MAKDANGLSPRAAILGLRGIAVAALFGAALASMAMPAEAALSADQIKRQVETRYGVTVLRIKPVTE